MNIDGVLMEARFIKRLNRFAAIVDIEGTHQLTHVPNTGRLRELLTEGAEILIRKYDNPARKTRYGLLLVKKDGIWISIDSANVPNKIVFDALRSGLFEQYYGYNELRREVTKGNSRFDFGLFSDTRECYIEVKGVTLVEERQAFFPDAPTSRGTRHLEELTRLRLEGKDAGVVFIIQREDADVIRPNDRTDKAFGDALRLAERSGVNIDAYTCRVDVEQRQIDIVRQIPVITGS